jgi:hypothetical protein
MRGGTRDESRKDRRSLAWGVVFVAILGCARAGLVEGPSPPDIAIVTSIVITPLDGVARESRTFDDPARIRAILLSQAFAQQGWSPVGTRNLEPLYRIEFRVRGQGVFVYLLGSNSYPPRFPCYALCTGWWLEVTRQSEHLGPRYKPLPEVVYFPLLRDLEIPAGSL